MYSLGIARLTFGLGDKQYYVYICFLSVDVFLHVIRLCAFFFLDWKWLFNIRLCVAIWNIFLKFFAILLRWHLSLSISECIAIFPWYPMCLEQKIFTRSFIYVVSFKAEKIPNSKSVQQFMRLCMFLLIWCVSVFYTFILNRLVSCFNATKVN